MAVIASQIYFRFLFWPRLTFDIKLSAYQIFTRYQSTTEILLLPVSENKRPPY